MYPDRIDRMVLDGVANVHEFYQNKYEHPLRSYGLSLTKPTREREMYIDADNVFRGFCSGCVNASDNCPLGRNTTATELESDIYSMLERVKHQPFPVTVPALGPQVIDYNTVKSRIISDLYSPSLWPSTASFIHGLMENNHTAIAEYLASVLVRPAGMEAEAQFGIKCSDAYGQATPDDVAMTIQTRHESSQIGGDTADFVPMICAHWKLAPKERYNGDFKAKTKTPILFIGNTADPVTPLVSARNVSSGFEGSVVLQHDGYGVGYFQSLPFTCETRS